MDLENLTGCFVATSESPSLAANWTRATFFGWGDKTGLSSGFFRLTERLKEKKSHDEPTTTCGLIQAD